MGALPLSHFGRLHLRRRCGFRQVLLKNAQESGPWFAILSAGLSIAAGFRGYIQSKESDGQTS